MGRLVDLLHANPLLLLFAVVALGYPLGRIKIAGSSLGVASVLFAGLAVSALDPALKLPDIVYQLGLVIFVYTVGLANGRTFFASFRRQGLRDGAFVVGMLAFAAALATAAFAGLGLSPGLAAGLYAGSLTNTPALAGVVEYLQHAVSGPAREQLLAEPVVAYSVAYPLGVIGVLIAITLAERFWRIDYVAEGQRLRAPGVRSQPLGNQTIRITRPEVTGIPLRDLLHAAGWEAIVGRIRRGEHLSLATGATMLGLGDLVTLVGAPGELEKATAQLGEPSDERLELNRGEFDFRRIFVSDQHVVGRRLRDLHLQQRFDALVTRVRRGDVEFLPHGDTILELGDRVRVVAPREALVPVSHFFGDSYRALSEIDILTFSLGLALGLLAGTVPIPLPGGVSLSLGLAGGPLVVALVLGALDRTGPLAWGLPYSANLTLRQLGLILFLAGVGTRAGYAFVTTFTSGAGVVLFLAGAVITCATATLALWIGYRWLGIPMGMLIGMVAGLHTQPAVLGFALERTGDESPNLGYAAVFPIATIAKILIAQLLLTLWR